MGQDGLGYATETNNSQIWWVEDNRSSFMLIPPAHYRSAGASAPCSLPSVINEEEIATNRNIDDFRAERKRVCGRSFNDSGITCVSWP